MRGSFQAKGERGIMDAQGRNHQPDQERITVPDQRHSLERRDFLKAAAGFGALAAGAGILGGCSPSEQTPSSDGGKTAASNAPESVSFSAQHPWLGEKPEIDSADIAETVDTEIVIVGGGNSGLPCALAAVDGGAKVVVLETQPQDSMSWYGMADIATLNSDFMTSMGVPHIDPVEFLVDIQKRTQNRSDPRIVKKYIDHSGSMLDWLVSELDPEFVASAQVPNFPGGNATYFENGGDIHGFKTWVACLRLINASAPNGWPVLVQKAVDRGVDWRWEHTGVVVVQDDSGKATGVIAKDADGAYKQFNASKAVVLAGGDYGGNPEMYVSLQNEMREEWQARGLDPTGITSAFGRDGSGIKMGMWAGGVIEPGPHCKIWPDIVFNSQTYAPNELKWGASYDLGPNPEHADMDPIGTAWFCVRASDGRRFTDEGMMGIVGMTNRVEHLPEEKYLHIWDDKWPEFLPRMSAEHFMPYSTPDQIERWRKRLDGWIAAGAAGEPRTDDGEVTCWAANSLEELLDYMGVKGDIKANILDEIERFNGFCANGVDEDFGKDPQLLMSIDQPPYYGMYNVSEKPMVGTCALNGLNIDVQQHVLSTKGEPIPSLYATGNNSGGRFSIQYSEPSPGVSIGMALTLGRELGKELAEL